MDSPLRDMKLNTIIQIEGIEVYHKGDTFLDPLFWQSLGKVMRWIGYKRSGIVGEIEYHNMEVWKAEWHRFIDHIADGGSAESFFENL